MGPLAGIRVIEMKGIGPAPYAGMLLADMGAEVVVVERDSGPSGIAPPSRLDIQSRGKQSIALDLKNESGLETLMRLVESADVLMEGYRPGVAERLGFGPDTCLERNSRLIYGRMTGWGQTGPLSQVAGHDINYISLTGALAAMGGGDKPVAPLNLLGDYAGGGLFLVMGILAALLETKNSGKGQVVDTAIIDGAASLMTMIHTMGNLGAWSTQRNVNFLDGASHYYNTYETLDGKFVSIGSIEPQFYALLLEKASLDADFFKDQHNPDKWPDYGERLAEVFKAKTRDEWCELMEGEDVCFAPVLDFLEAPQHFHNRARATYISIDDVVQPAPAPRFSRTGCDPPAAPASEGEHTKAVLERWGFSRGEIDGLYQAGALP